MVNKIKNLIYINDEFFIFPIIEKIKTNNDYKRLFSNFVSLSILQAANYLLPLITLPYLVRVLGPEKFGLISFAQAFITYFGIITDYGFNLSATREISINRDNKEKVSEIFSSVMIIKAGLLLVSFILLSIIVFSFEKFRNDWLIYYLTFGVVVGQILFPIWFFQGMEQMKYITILNILAKLIFTIVIFIFVKKTNDYIYVPLLNSIGFILIGIISLWVVYDNFGIRFIKPNIRYIKIQLKEGWHIFISTITISLYTISNTFILGLFTNNTIVGYYAGAEKIIRALQSLYGPISQVLYPYISKMILESYENGIKFIRKIFKLSGFLNFCITSITFVFSEIIIMLLLGKEYKESVKVLKILSFLPFLIGLSNVLGIQLMLNLGYDKDFLKIVGIASIINLVMLLILVPHFKHIGSGVSVLISEFYVTLAMYVFLSRKRIKVIG